MTLAAPRHDPTDHETQFDALDDFDPEVERIRNHTFAILAVTVAVLLVAGLSTAISRRADATEGHTIAGGMTLGSNWGWERSSLTKWTPGSYRDSDGSATLPDGAPCWGQKGYDDMKAGAEVLVKNEAGATIATGTLGTGGVDGDQTIAMLASSSIYSRGEYTPGAASGSCTLPFTIENVPKAKFYKIEIGRRQGPTFSHADMESDNWSPVLTLG